MVRVQADGYFPEESKPFAGNGTPQTLGFRLNKGEPVRGLVRNPDGSAARDGFVYLVPADDVLSLVNGDVPDLKQEGLIRSKLSPEDRFSLPPENGTFLLVALNDAGFALAHRREFRESNPLRLQPWAKVSGTVTIDHKPIADLESYRNDHQFAIVSLSLDEKADILARFVKDHKLPWLQGLVGPQSPVVTTYGATAIPATFLIGPDGRIITRDLRGKRAKEAVAKALNR